MKSAKTSFAVLRRADFGSALAACHKYRHTGESTTHAGRVIIAWTRISCLVVFIIFEGASLRLNPILKARDRTAGKVWYCSGRRLLMMETSSVSSKEPNNYGSMQKC